MPLDPADESALHKKLGLSGLRPGARVLVVGAPEGDDDPLGSLPEDAVKLSTLEELEPPGATSSEEGAKATFDYIHVFARSRAELSQSFPRLVALLAPAGMLWVSWVKLSSGRREVLVEGDLNENLVRRLALTNGLVDVKVAAVDEDWAALKLLRRKR
jgi:hypothetical protein